MDLKTIFEHVLPVAEKIAALTETTVDDATVKVLKCLFDHFGPLLFGAGGDGRCAMDDIPSDAVADVETLIARIEQSPAQ